MKSEVIWASQLFVYFQLFVYLVPNSVIHADMNLVMEYKVVTYEKCYFWWFQLFVYFQLLVYFRYKPCYTCRYDLTDVLHNCWLFLPKLSTAKIAAGQKGHCPLVPFPFPYVNSNVRSVEKITEWTSIKMPTPGRPRLPLRPPPMLRTFGTSSTAPKTVFPDDIHSETSNVGEWIEFCGEGGIHDCRPLQDGRGIRGWRLYQNLQLAGRRIPQQSCHAISLLSEGGKYPQVNRLIPQRGKGKKITFLSIWPSSSAETHSLQTC